MVRASFATRENAVPLLFSAGRSLFALLALSTTSVSAVELLCSGWSGLLEAARQPLTLASHDASSEAVLIAAALGYALFTIGLAGGSLLGPAYTENRLVRLLRTTIATNLAAAMILLTVATVLWTALEGAAARAGATLIICCWLAVLWLIRGLLKGEEVAV